MSTMAIPIAMATDDNYAYPMFVSLTSLFISADKDTTYNLHLLLDKNFTETNFERLAMIQKGFGRHKVEVHVMDRKYDDIKINIDYIKTATFYRLELLKLLSDVNKCIYLDVDTIVNKDLSELFRLNIDDKYIAGVRAAAYYYPENNARGYSNKLGIDNIFSYVNAGVLLINLNKMRKDGLMDVFNELIKKDFPSMDQDILNSACYGKVRILHPKYNAMTKYSLKDDGAYQSMKCLQFAYTLEEWDTARKQPVIIHYADKIKPWNDLSVDYAEKWWRVATELPFFKEIYQHYYEQIINAAKVKKQINTLHKQYEKYSTLRIDIRNKGDKGCDVIEQGIVPQPLSVRKPEWLPGGVTVESIAECMSVAVQCKGDGELEIGLMGRDVRNEAGKRYPVWIDCTYFAVNGGVIFADTKTVCHDKRYVYRKPVVDGEVIKLDVAWSECRSSNVLDEFRQLQVELKNSKNKTNQLQKANAKTLKELNETQRKAAKLDKELQNVKNGWSFKIGRIITYIPRKITKHH